MLHFKIRLIYGVLSLIWGHRDRGKKRRVEVGLSKLNAHSKRPLRAQFFGHVKIKPCDGMI